MRPFVWGHSLRESGAGIWASSAQEGSRPHGSASRTTSVDGSSLSTGPTSPASPTFATSADARTVAPFTPTLLLESVTSGPPSMFSAAASPAKISALQERAPDSPGSARVFGSSTFASFASSNRDGYWWKTYRRSAPEVFTSYLKAWPRAGMTRSGTAFQLQPLARIIKGTVSGLLPTPSAASYGNNQGVGNGRTGKVRHSLQSMARTGLWPTPTATMGDSGGRGDLIQAVRGNVSPSGHFKMWPTPMMADSDRTSETYPRGNPTLLGAVRNWPTPTVQDSANNGGPAQFRRNSLPLNAAVKIWRTPNASDALGGRMDSDETIISGRRPSGVKAQLTLRSDIRKAEIEAGQPKSKGSLNPDWVEWLMGFPAGWTDVG